MLYLVALLVTIAISSPTSDAVARSQEQDCMMAAFPRFCVTDDETGRVQARGDDYVPPYAFTASKAIFTRGADIQSTPTIVSYVERSDELYGGENPMHDQSSVSVSVNHPHGRHTPTSSGAHHGIPTAHVAHIAHPHTTTHHSLTPGKSQGVDAPSTVTHFGAPHTTFHHSHIATVPEEIGFASLGSLFDQEIKSTYTHHLKASSTFHTGRHTPDVHDSHDSSVISRLSSIQGTRSIVAVTIPSHTHVKRTSLNNLPHPAEYTYPRHSGEPQKTALHTSKTTYPGGLHGSAPLGSVGTSSRIVKTTYHGAPHGTASHTNMHTYLGNRGHSTIHPTTLL